MSNKFTEELRNFWSCLKDEQSLCGAFLSADFCGDGAQDFSLGRRMATAILTADFSYGGAILTAPKPLQDKALSKGGGG